MENNETPVSHVDLYHKLGKLEGLMETMMASVSSFQVAIKDVHSRIDALENRQAMLENNQSNYKGVNSTLAALGRDFMIPILAIIITWLVAKDTDTKDGNTKLSPQSSIPQLIRPGIIVADKK